MKYIPLDQSTLKRIDHSFNSMFEHHLLDQISIDLYSIFPWTHDFNSEDIQIMFEDVQRELYLENYVPKRYLKTPIKFLNFILKQIPNLTTVYLKPYCTNGIFRTYYLEQR